VIRTIRTAAAIGFVMLGALRLAGMPAMAQTAPTNPAVVEGFPLPLALPPAANTGKPRFVVPAPPDPPPPGGCAAAFDCRVRVIGAIQHDGAVELNADVLKW
jgi:hypothetical protein